MKNCAVVSLLLLLLSAIGCSIAAEADGGRAVASRRKLQPPPEEDPLSICGDDPGFTYFHTNKKGKTKAYGDCNFVARKRKRRCKRTQPDGLKVWHSCPITCRKCNFHPLKYHKPQPVVGGCEIKYLNLYIQNDLDVPLYAISGAPSQGGQDVPGCNGCSKGSTCDYNNCWSVSPGTQNVININDSGSSCQGADGTFTFGPSNPSYTTQTGLESITMHYQDGGGPNGNTNFNLQFNVPSPKGYTFGQSSPTSVCSNSRKCHVQFEVNAQAPATSAPVSFSDYVGSWKFVASSASVTITAGTSWSDSQSSTYGSSFTAGFTEGTSVKFPPAKVTAGASQTMQSTSSQTIGTSKSGSYGISCGTNTCPGRLYQWSTEASGSDGTTQIVQSCFFQCVASSTPNAPQCPVGFCENSSCQCCNAVWIDGNNSTIDNHLAPSAGGNCTSSCVSPGGRCGEDADCCAGTCEIGSGTQGNACS